MYLLISQIIAIYSMNAGSIQPSTLNSVY